MHAHRIGPSVADVMTEEPVTVAAEENPAQAAHLMDVHHVSALPVVDDHGTLAGLLSQTDLMRARTTAALWQRWPTLQGRDLMTAPALTVAMDASIVDAARTMEAEHVHRLVVTGADDQMPVGVVSVSDLVRVIGDLR
ncbi:MAG TPA: CBS domain-containing protein [Candidatus Limnocylindrales bacterium]|nr:CBS domain-containing protein [Candidatus Limnocylindrales bacterium]